MSDDSRHTIYPISCIVCGRDVAVSSRRPTGVFFCSWFCAMDENETPNEERDSLVQYLMANGYTLKNVAELFDLSFQRIAQIRDLRLEPRPALTPLADMVIAGVPLPEMFERA